MGNLLNKKQKNQNASSNWSQLSSCKTRSKDASVFLASNPIILNSNEFVIAPWAYNNSKESEPFYKYNTTKNEWSIYRESPKSFTLGTKVLWFHTCIDQKINKIYVGNQCSSLSIIDYDTNINELQQTNIPIDGSYTFIMTINNTLHIIGCNSGKPNIKHMTADLNGNNIRTVFTFDENIQGFDAIIHLKSNKQIYAFGGRRTGAGYNFSREIWKHNIGSNEWIKFDLYKFHLPRQIGNVGAVVTVDEKYILFFGGGQGWHNGEDVVEHDYIFILDLVAMKFRKSDIVCPRQSSSYFPIIMKSVKDELLVYGYLRKNTFVPHDIYKQILLWFDDEYVHLLDYGSCRINSIEPIQQHGIPLYNLLHRSHEVSRY